MDNNNLTKYISYEKINLFTSGDFVGYGLL